MGTTSSDERPQQEPPLWSIGLTVGLILIAPLALYSLAPTGPLRGGDTIFSEGQQRVSVVHSQRQESDVCLLNPGHPLIIIESPTERSDGRILAEVQGSSLIEWPFCPPHATVLLHMQQIVQKPDVAKDIENTLIRLLGRLTNG